MGERTQYREEPYDSDCDRSRISRGTPAAQLRGVAAARSEPPQRWLPGCPGRVARERPGDPARWASPLCDLYAAESTVPDHTYRHGLTPRRAHLDSAAAARATQPE